MKTLGKAVAAIMLCGALAGVAGAENYNSGRYNNRERRDRHSINQRQRQQQRRIGEGVENGSLTPREAARLEREQGRFNREEARLRQGGLNGRERERLEDQQDRMSRQIYRQRHDGQGR